MNKKVYKLPKKVTEEWLKALRGDEYNQTKGMLYDNITEGYCCLGVLCKLDGADNEDLLKKEMPSNLFDNGDANALTNSFPNELLADSKHDPMDLLVVLPILNDGFTKMTMDELLQIHPDLIFSKIDWSKGGQVRYTFKEIADFIENNIELV